MMGKRYDLIGQTFGRLEVVDFDHPENCRWADRITQQSNRRGNHYFTYAGETKTLAEWTRCLGVKYSTLWYRIARGDLRDFEEYFMEDN